MECGDRNDADMQDLEDAVAAMQADFDLGADSKWLDEVLETVAAEFGDDLENPTQMAAAGDAVKMGNADMMQDAVELPLLQTARSLSCADTVLHTVPSNASEVFCSVPITAASMKYPQSGGRVDAGNVLGQEELNPALIGRPLTAFGGQHTAGRPMGNLHRSWTAPSTWLGGEGDQGILNGSSPFQTPPNGPSLNLFGVPGGSSADSNSSSGKLKTEARPRRRKGGSNGLSQDQLKQLDPKRVKRILSNRASAARSKERKLFYIGTLEEKTKALSNMNRALRTQLLELDRHSFGLGQETRQKRQEAELLKEAIQKTAIINDSLRRQVSQTRSTSFYEANPGGQGQGQGMHPPVLESHFSEPFPFEHYDVGSHDFLEQPPHGLHQSGISEWEQQLDRLIHPATILGREGGNGSVGGGQIQHREFPGSMHRSVPRTYSVPVDVHALHAEHSGDNWSSGALDHPMQDMQPDVWRKTSKVAV